MKKYRRFFRCVLFFLIFLFFAIWAKTFLWVAFLVLSIFFFAVDVYSVDKRKKENDSIVEKYSGPFGVLGGYVVDATESYGLFIELLNAPVFIDIRRDEFMERREQQAKYLFERQNELETSLMGFMNATPEFKNKRVLCIGLHSKVMDQGEVFWSPDGYTLLSGTSFLA